MVRRSSRIRNRNSESSVTDADYHSDISTALSDYDSSTDVSKNKKPKQIKRAGRSKKKVLILPPTAREETSPEDNNLVNDLKKIEEEDNSIFNSSLIGDPNESSSKLKSISALSENSLSAGKQPRLRACHDDESEIISGQPQKFSFKPSKLISEFITVDEKKSLGILSGCIFEEQCFNIPFLSLLRKSHTEKPSDDISSDIFGLHLADVSNDSSLKQKDKKSMEIQVSSSFSLPSNNSSKLHKTSALYVQKNSRKQVDELMKKSVLPDNLEQMEKAPQLFESYASLKRERKKKQQETAGKGWFNMPKPELTDELKRDLQVIQMRNALDAKRHYKRADSKKMPTYFQIGTIVEGAHEFHSARVSKKQRKRTIVDELLADAEFRRKNKKRFIEIQKKNFGSGKGHYKKNKNKRKPTLART